MSVHRRKDGQWFCKYYEQGREKRYYGGQGQAGRAEAYRFQRRRDEAKARGRQPDPPQARTTFNLVAREYLEHHPLAPNTKYAIQHALNAHVVRAWGNLPLDQLDARHLLELDHSLAGRSLATRNRYKSYCKAILNWGLKNGLVPKHLGNPFADYHPDIKREDPAPDPPTPAELDRLMALSPPHLWWAIESLLNLGLRPGRSELLAVRLDQFDFERGGLVVPRPKTRTRSFIPCPPAYLEKIRFLRRADPARQYLVEFQNRQVTTLKTAWRQTKKRAGITRRLRLYDLRHLYITRLLSAGADPKAVSLLAGHADVTTTLRVYYHLQDEQLKEAVRKIS